MARPPFNRNTPIAQQGFITPEFSRWLDTLTIASDGDTSAIDAINTRLVAVENQIVSLQSVDIALAGSIQTNTNNIASLVFDVSALQASVTGLLAEQFEPVAVHIHTDELEPV